MQELIKKLMDETNLDEKMAEKAIEVVMKFLEDKLPAPIQDQVKNVLAGGEELDLGDAADRLKDLF